MKGKASLLGFVVFVGLFFVGFWYVSLSAQSIDLSFQDNTTVTSEFTQSSYWLNSSNSASYSSNCLERNNETLYVDGNNVCTWNSINYSTNGSDEDGRPLRFDYIADPEEGTIDVTVATYDVNDTELESYNFEINTGTDSVDLSNQFSNNTDPHHVDVELVLNQQNKNDLIEPNVDEYSLTTLDEERSIDAGLTDDDAYIFTMMIFLISGVLIVASFLSEA